MDNSIFDVLIVQNYGNMKFQVGCPKVDITKQWTNIGRKPNENEKSTKNPTFEKMNLRNFQEMCGHMAA